MVSTLPSPLKSYKIHEASPTTIGLKSNTFAGLTDPMDLRESKVASVLVALYPNGSLTHD